MAVTRRRRSSGNFIFAPAVSIDVENVCIVEVFVSFVLASVKVSAENHDGDFPKRG